MVEGGQDILSYGITQFIVQFGEASGFIHVTTVKYANLLLTTIVAESHPAIAVEMPDESVVRSLLLYRIMLLCFHTNKGNSRRVICRAFLYVSI